MLLLAEKRGLRSYRLRSKPAPNAARPLQRSIRVLGSGVVADVSKPVTKPELR